MREKGDVLEGHVLETWPVSIGSEANSGAKYGENDLVSSQHSIECKRKLKQQSLSLSGKELKKCINRANNRNKEACWVVETTLGMFVVTRYDDYCNTIFEHEDMRASLEDGKETRTTS